jgi:peptidase A4-like protein
MRKLQNSTITVVAGAVALLSASISSVQAQSLMRESPSGVPGVTVVTPPPRALDMRGASETTLKQYGVPPRPNATAAPGAYAKWMNAVGNIQNREPATANSTNLRNGSARGLAPATTPARNNGYAGTSENWSGTVVTGGTLSTVQAVIGEFTVPKAQQAMNTCAASWAYSSLWPGIDGYGSSDVLQGGAEVDAYCSGGITDTFYSAWVEWFPDTSTRVSSPVIAPGDLLFVEVWSVSPIEGYVFFFNYSTNISAQYHLTAPSGTSLKGSSVEWIVERPSLGTTLATLTNYVHSAWPYGMAWNYAVANPTYYYQGADPQIGNLTTLTMLDETGTGISSATIENSDFLWFENYGSSCKLSTAPPC